MDHIFANVLGYFRKKYGLSHKIVLLKTGIAQSELSKLEEGTHWPNQKNIAKFCNGLGISGKDFLLYMGVSLINTALHTTIWLDDGKEDEENGRNNKHQRRSNKA